MLRVPLTRRAARVDLPRKRGEVTPSKRRRPT
jgi:hypothetical protein